MQLQRVLACLEAIVKIATVAVDCNKRNLSMHALVSERAGSAAIWPDNHLQTGFRIDRELIRATYNKIMNEGCIPLSDTNTAAGDRQCGTQTWSLG